MKIKSFLSILLVVPLLALAACGNSSLKSSGSQNGVIDISFYNHYSPDTSRGKALQSVVDQYNKENAGKVHVTMNVNPDFPTFESKVKTMIAANKTPDLFTYNFNPNDLSRQNSGKLQDFSSEMNGQWKSSYNAQDLKTLTVNNKLTSIPLEKNPVVFYYNKKLFAKAGITSFPTTWDDFFAVCDKLKKAGITPISLMTQDDAWHASNALTYLAASAGGVNIFDVGKSLNNQAIVTAANDLQKLFSYTTGDAIGANYSVSSNHFINGETAMIIDGPWLIGSLNKDMQSDIGVAPAPVLKDGKVTKGLIVTDAQTSLAGAKQSDTNKEKAVINFLKYLCSPEVSKTLTIDGQMMVSSKTTLTPEDVKNAGPTLGQVINVRNDSLNSIVQITRVLTKNANAQLPSLIEGLAMKNITPKQFAQQLQDANH